MMQLDNREYRKGFSDLLSQLEPSNMCIKATDYWLSDEYFALKKYTSSDIQTKKEVSSMKMRLLADAYQDSQLALSAITNRLLLGILVCNVFAMVSLSIFLRYDSEDIG